MEGEREEIVGGWNERGERQGERWRQGKIREGERGGREGGSTFSPCGSPSLPVWPLSSIG